MWIFSYWLLPVLSACMWLGMLEAPIPTGKPKDSFIHLKVFSIGFNYGAMMLICFQQLCFWACSSSGRLMVLRTIRVWNLVKALRTYTTPWTLELCARPEMSPQGPVRPYVLYRTNWFLDIYQTLEPRGYNHSSLPAVRLQPYLLT